jgi:hypothetical protein
MPASDSQSFALKLLLHSHGSGSRYMSFTVAGAELPPFYLPDCSSRFGEIGELGEDGARTFEPRLW